MKDLWRTLKKKPAMLIGVIFAIIAVLYIVYKSSAANKQTSGQPGTASDPNAQSGQLGGYLQFEEDVLNPTPVNVTVGKTTVNTKTVTNIPSHVKIFRTKEPSHHPVPHHRGGHIPVSPPPHGGRPGGVPGIHATHIKSPVPLSVPPQHNTRLMPPTRVK
jgi:hypothetical protein